MCLSWISPSVCSEIGGQFDHFFHYKDFGKKLLGSYKNLSDKLKKEYCPYLSDYLKNL